MEAYELEMTAEDIGEAVEMIRIQVLKMHEETFCKKLGISEKVLFSVEQGRGPHGMMVLKKIHKEFPLVNVKVSVEIL
jgi:ribosome-binding protein aMBF1 (putative translation factor)